MLPLFHKITFSSLKNLVVDHCIIDFYDDEDGTHYDNDEPSIVAPHLSHLHVVLNVGTKKVSVKAVSSLIEATIHLVSDEDGSMRYNQWLFVSNLFNARSLELSGLHTMVCLLSLISISLWSTCFVVFFQLNNIF